MNLFPLQVLTLDKFSPDSLQARAGQTIEVIKNTEPSVLLQGLLNQAIHFGLKVVAALAIYFIGGWIVRRIQKLVRRGFERKGADAALSGFVTSLVSISLWVILIIITVGTLGINTTSLAALLAAGGMAVGMALSGTVQNFAGGIMLLVFKPFRAGDFIEAQGYSGTVKELNITCTKLITVDNRLVVLPNGSLSNGTINNYSANPLRRVDWEVSVAYGSDAEEVKRLLTELMKEDPRILDATVPGAADPFAALHSLNASDIKFVCRAWVKKEDYWNVFFDFNGRVYSSLPENGVNFAFPQLDVHIDRS